VPRKLGQHYLHRQDLLRRIAGAAYRDSPERIIEIGPGRGALPKHPLEGPAQVTAIEVDAALIPDLQDRFALAGNFELIQADILEADLTSRLPAVVAGNLPYYITSPIIAKVLSLGSRLRHAVFLIQKEVADRLSAGPGSRDFGYLSVQTQLLSEPETLFKVPPSAFKPPPKVDSAVVLLKPRPAPLVNDTAAFLKFASACFRQKRKTLRNNLKPLYPAIADQPESRLRAEQLPLENLIDLFGRIES
jgi:16S rRNA (adenine1518-N6/adenine1519-N6)-dimethyltransferase